MSDINQEKEMMNPEVEKRNFLRARFRNRFEIGKKQYKKIVREQFNRLKIFGLLFSFALIVILVWLAIFNKEYQIYIYASIVFPLALAVYIVLTIVFFLKKIDDRIRQKKYRINYDIYFFKNSFVVRSYICEDKFKVKMRPFAEKAFDNKSVNDEDKIDDKCELFQENINYEEILRLVEAKQYIYIVTKKKVYFINKDAKYKKRKSDTIDTLRKYLQEKTNLYIYVSAYCPGRLFESYYEIDYQLTLQENTSYILICLSILSVVAPIAFNLVPASKFQYLWLFWLGLGICVVDLLAILFMRYKRATWTWRFNTVITISVIGIIISFIFGITGTIKNQNIAATAELYQVCDEIGISLPEKSTLNDKLELSREEGNVTYYRKELVQTFTNDEEVSIFESSIQSSQDLWKDTISDDDSQITPDDIDVSESEYFLYYDIIDQRINPSYDQAKNNSIIWLITYDVDKDMLYSFNYNIVSGLMY